MTCLPPFQLQADSSLQSASKALHAAGTTHVATHNTLSRSEAPTLPRSARAFSLLEVMIASGIFFMATFAILALVSTTLRNARALGRGEVDVGMAAAQIYQFAKTNREAEFSGSGDFGDAYPGFSFEYASQEYMTNGLLQVDIVVHRRGSRLPYDSTSIWVYSPNARSGPGPR